MGDPVPFTDEVPGAPASADPAWPPLWAADPLQQHVENYADLHPDDKEWARSVDHTGLPDAFDALSAEDKLAALHPNAHPFELPSASDIAQGGAVPDSTIAGRAAGAPMFANDADAVTGAAGADQTGSPLGAPAPISPDLTPINEALPRDFSGSMVDSEATQEQRNAEAARLATSTDPEDQKSFAAVTENNRRANELEQSQSRLRALQDTEAQLKREMQSRQQAADDARAQSNRIQQQLQDLNRQKVDPNRWYNSRTTGQKVGAWIAAIAGGFAAGQVPGGNGQNHFIDNMMKTIDTDIDAQKSDIANGRANLEAQNGIVAQQFARNGNLNDAAEVARQASYQNALAQIQTQAQQFDPAGTTAIQYGQAQQQVVARMQQSAAATAKQTFDQHLEAYKAETPRMAEEETKRKNLVDEEFRAQQAALKAGGGTGAAGGTGAYTVPVAGAFDPFTKQQIFAKGKPEDPKKIGDDLVGYRTEQDLWRELAAKGAAMEGHKSLGASTWKRFQQDDEREYEAARQTLLAHTLKETGVRDNPENRAEMGAVVPDLKSLGESGDPLKRIADAQARSDEKFATKMNVAGVDGDSVIRNALVHRAPPPLPSAKTGLADAQGAAAANPKGKDEARGLEDAHARVTEEIALKNQQDSDIDKAALVPHKVARIKVDSTAYAPAVESTAVAANVAADRLDKVSDMYRKAADDQSYIKKGMLPAEIASVAARHHIEVARLAHEVVLAKDAYDTEHARAAKALFIPSAPLPAKGMGDINKETE